MLNTQTISNGRCPYFGECGGCSAQHVDYAVQVENKRKVVADACGVRAGAVKVFAGEEWGYRNRMDLSFHPRGVGFRRKGKWHQIVDVRKCLISEPRLNELIEEVRRFFCVDAGIDAFDLRRHTGTFRYAVIRTPRGDSSVSFVLCDDSTRLDGAIELIREFAAQTSADNVIVTYMPHNTDVSTGDDFFVVKGSENLKAVLTGREFEFSVQGFWQNNSAMAEKMHEYVRGVFAKYDEADRGCLLDLYAGVGTFGINNADLFGSVKIVESFAPAVELARANLARNGVKNAEAIVLDAKRLKNLVLGGYGACGPSSGRAGVGGGGGRAGAGGLFVVTDPPRSGMHPKTIECLRKLRPETIIYISCNVKQLGKDVKKFSEYKVKSIAMFDLFPQTVHCEAVAEMARKRT